MWWGILADWQSNPALGWSSMRLSVFNRVLFLNTFRDSDPTSSLCQCIFTHFQTYWLIPELRERVWLLLWCFWLEMPSMLSSALWEGEMRILCCIFGTLLLLILLLSLPKVIKWVEDTKPQWNAWGSCWVEVRLGHLLCWPSSTFSLIYTWAVYRISGIPVGHSLFQKDQQHDFASSIFSPFFALCFLSMLSWKCFWSQR